MLIQYLLSFLILLIIYRVVIKWRQGILTSRDSVFWIGFWFVVGIIILLPDTTSYLAELVGVGRGADLIVYLSIVLIFYIIFQMTIKIEKIERNITKVVRTVAMKDEAENNGQQTKNEKTQIVS
ncbi:MAG: DUF2304 domain-containing protein [Patescibacteria group bacterium]|jgi:hypothetical protein